jgi:hypothetical protein
MSEFNFERVAECKMPLGRDAITGNILANWKANDSGADASFYAPVEMSTNDNLRVQIPPRSIQFPPCQCWPLLKKTANLWISSKQR